MSETENGLDCLWSRMPYPLFFVGAFDLTGDERLGLQRHFFLADRATRRRIGEGVYGLDAICLTEYEAPAHHVSKTRPTAAAINKVLVGKGWLEAVRHEKGSPPTFRLTRQLAEALRRSVSEITVDRKNMPKQRIPNHIRALNEKRRDKAVVTPNKPLVAHDKAIVPPNKAVVDHTSQFAPSDSKKSPDLPAPPDKAVVTPPDKRFVTLPDKAVVTKEEVLVEEENRGRRLPSGVAPPTLPLIARTIPIPNTDVEEDDFPQRPFRGWKGPTGPRPSTCRPIIVIERPVPTKEMAQAALDRLRSNGQSESAMQTALDFVVARCVEVTGEKMNVGSWGCGEIRTAIRRCDSAKLDFFETVDRCAEAAKAENNNLATINDFFSPVLDKGE